jgi:ATPase family associated with various cellular activities (AAA)
MSVPDSSDVAIAITKLLTTLLEYKRRPVKASTGRAPAGVTGVSLVPVSQTPPKKLGNFSTRNAGFYDHVREIRALIRDFADRPSARKPLNLLISAPPGSGKSFLVKQLLGGGSGEVGVPYLELNVANLSKRSSLGAAWTFVRTMESNHIRPCVFFDEIDAKVDGEYVLQDVLMPMYDAAVIFEGAKLALGPAIFIFAGSKLFETQSVLGESAGKIGPGSQPVKFSTWRKDREEAIRKLGAPSSNVEGATDRATSPPAPKIRDFLDRIDRCIIFPDSTVAFTDMDEEAKQWEKIDLVLSMIHRHFPHVEGVEPAAAFALATALIEGSSKRSAERLVFTAIVPPKEPIFKFPHLPVDARGLLTDQNRKELEAKYKGEAFTVE